MGMRVRRVLMGMRVRLVRRARLVLGGRIPGLPALRVRLVLPAFRVRLARAVVLVLPGMRVRKVIMVIRVRRVLPVIRVRRARRAKWACPVRLVLKDPIMETSLSSSVRLSSGSRTKFRPEGTPVPTATTCESCGTQVMYRRHASSRHPAPTTPGHCAPPSPVADQPPPRHQRQGKPGQTAASHTEA